MPPVHATYAATARFGSFDGLRALAALAVVWHHSPAARGAQPWAALQRGYLGVDLFFALSGFLITALLLRERAAHGRVDVARFLLRRLLRLAPLYYAVLAGAALVSALAPSIAFAAPFLADLPWHATFTSNWVHTAPPLTVTWSLAAEEQFYVAWAFALRALGEGGLAIAAAVVALGALVTAGALDGALAGLLGPDFRSLDMVQATFTPLALGALAAGLLHRPAGFALAARLLGARAVAPLALLAVLALASAPEAEPLRFTRPWAQLALTVLVAACALREDHGLAPLLRWTPLARLGVVSYGVYLLHVLTLQATRPLGLRWEPAPGLAVFALNLLAAWAAAELAFRVIERPCNRWRERLRPR